VAIVLSHLYHGSNKFTKATVVSQRSGYSNQNPVLFHDNVTDTNFLFHSQQQADKGESKHVEI
jgi:predicted neuraminidase